MDKTRASVKLADTMRSASARMSAAFSASPRRLSTLSAAERALSPSSTTELAALAAVAAPCPSSSLVGVNSALSAA